jgi:transposase-like protein
VDPHKLSATIETLDDREKVLGGGRFGTDRDGYRQMLATARRWPDRVWAVEGCNGIGRHLAQRLNIREPGGAMSGSPRPPPGPRPNQAQRQGVCCIAGSRRWLSSRAEEAGRMRRPGAARPNADRSAFAGFRFPPEVITVAVHWYLRYGLSYRDVEELLAERGIEVDHVTVYRWVQRFTPLFVEAARPFRHAAGDRWFVDETYVKVAGRWRYLYRAVDQYGQVIDVLMSEQRDTTAARWFFTRALTYGPAPVEVTTDKAGPYLRVVDEFVPAAAHIREQYENNPIESDHARLKARLRPMRGLKQFRSAARIAAGHAFAQNVRRGHYELATELAPQLRLAIAFTELAQAM